MAAGKVTDSISIDSISIDSISIDSISIIVPLYNEGENVWGLVHHLREVAAQHEVILVDASDDAASIELIKRVEKFAGNLSGWRVLSAANSAVNSGRAVQMNAGARRASGRILVFLHCDTRLTRASLRHIQAAVGKGAKWGRFNIVLNAHGFIYRLIETMMWIRSRLRKLATGDQVIFVRTELFFQVGGFLEIPLMEDIALSTKLSRLHKPALIAEPVQTSARRWQNRGAISTILLMWKLRFLYWVGVSPHRLNRLYGNER